MKGKDKCKILKEIRRQIAEENGIEWAVSECSHKGNCKGTCPKCESEVRKLEQELEFRRKIGKTVAIAGISAACVTGLTACSLEDVVDYGQQIIEGITDRINRLKEPEVLEGEVPTEIHIEDELSGYLPYNYEQEETTAYDPYSEEELILDGEVGYNPKDYGF